MNVVLRVVGVIVVNDELNIVNVESSSRHICGNEDGCIAVLELVQDPVAFFLLFVAVNAHRRKALATHQTGQVIGFALCFCEDENLVMRLASDLFQQPCQLLFLLGPTL